MKMPYGLLLFTVFLVLKLTHVIAWSWWWVCAPLIVWIAAIVGMAITASAKASR